MTLLESIVALVILGLTAVGFLELFERATVATRDTVAWSRAVAVAEQTMERAVVKPTAYGDSVDGLRRQVQLRPWRDGLRELIVTVDGAPSGGVHVVLHRLVTAR